MSGDSAATADVALGHGAGHDGEAHGTCLNCGTALIGSHCHACGQEGHVHRTIGAIWHEIAHGVLHADGKVFRTIPLLATRPGELTRRYIAGERARFVSPMAVFLFSIFTMFAVFSILGIAPPADINASNRLTHNAELALKDNRVERQALVKQRDALPDSDSQRQKIDAEIASIDGDIAVLEKVPGAVSSKNETVEVHTGWTRLDHGIEKWQTNPGLMLYKLQSNGYKFSWLLIPLSLPFIWLLFFWRRDVRMYDHAVFVTYSIAFMSMLMIALTLAGAFGMKSGAAFLIGSVVAIWHLYRHLKGAYLLSRGAAIVRTAILVVETQIVLGLFALALVMLGLVG